MSFIFFKKIMEALSTTSLDPSLLSAGAASSASPLATFQAISAMLGLNFWLIMIVLLGITVFFCIVFWKLFKKMGYKGYEALISGHNGYVMITAAGKQGRYYFLFLIPIVIMNAPIFLGMFNATALQTCSAIGTILFFVLYVDLTISLVKKFKKGMGFAIGTILLPIILAFGKAVYSLPRK